ncbi:MAG TPA: hypothetical protein IGS31_12210 [Oscillatoriales cyanobacterium M4454_W2019_049]|nr:hypothetical protein [Oscillatoriales cyanobacterium M4454_W2019_049]
MEPIIPLQNLQFSLACTRDLLIAPLRLTLDDRTSTGNDRDRTPGPFHRL